MTEATHHATRRVSGSVRSAGARPSVTPTGILLVQLPVACLLLLMYLVTVWLDVPVTAFMRDATAIAGINPLNGLASKLGAMLWSATAAIALFTAMLCRRGSEARGLFVYFGALTILLLFDDVFRVHDTFVPAMAPAGLEKAVYVFYAVALLYGLVRYRHVIQARGNLLLLVACACFAVSVASDTFITVGSGWVYWLEDGAKLFGIANWCACFTLLAADTLRSRQSTPLEG